MTNQMSRNNKTRWAVLLCAALALLLLREARSREALDLEAITDSFPIRKELGAPDTYYRGEPAKDGKIDLTIGSAFFDRCFKMGRDAGAEQYTDIRKSDVGVKYVRNVLIEHGTLRWHVWCSKAGTFTATFYMTVPEDEADYPWQITVGNKAHTPDPKEFYPEDPEKEVPVIIGGDDAETQTLKVNPSDGKSPQKQTLTFTVKKPGKIIFAFDCTKRPPPEGTRIHRVTLSGPAVAKGYLVRTAWRPPAEYTTYAKPADCPGTTLWVFETKSLNHEMTYSPITTAFGYYGTSFRANGGITKGRGLNFSHWIGSPAPPIQRMPRMIGTDYPEAEYNFWGNEGVGISLRNINVYPEGADRCILAMRFDWEWKEGVGTLITFYGYVYDEIRQRWMLYGVSQEAYGKNITRKPDQQPGSGGIQYVKSFVEVPGPYSLVRRGDMQRVVARRGWFYGSDGKWYRAHLAGNPPHSEYMAGAPLPPLLEAAKKRVEQLKSNKKIGMATSYEYYADDYMTSGWMITVTGGMEYKLVPSLNLEALKRDLKPEPLPEYLSPEKAAHLFEVPVTYGESKASEIGRTTALIDYEIKKTGPNSKAVLYYGTVDCLTFPYDPGAKVSHPTLKVVLGKERSWQSQTPARQVKAGIQKFRLAGLKPGTTYYYRLYVEHDEGKCWDFKSGSFKTTP